jgi:hypothetical protein
MKKIVFALFIVFYITSLECMAESVLTEKIIKLAKEACLANDNVEVTIGADGGVTLFRKIIGGVEGSVELKKSQINGAYKLGTDEARLIENSQQRACILQVLSMLRNAESMPTPKEQGENFLPSDQWLLVNSPLFILDGKVRLIIKQISEYRRNVLSSVRVEVPMRKPYQKNLFKGDSLSFTYYDVEYNVTVMDTILQEQRSKITVTTQ